jgi:hypothetical protein
MDRQVKKQYTVRIKGKADFDKTLNVHAHTVDDAIHAGLDAISQRDVDSLIVDTIRFRVDPAEGDADERATKHE